MTPPEIDRVIGDYRLLQKRLETPMALQWEAEQISVGRKVLVDELKPEAMDQREQFMSDVRAKATIRSSLRSMRRSMAMMNVTTPTSFFRVRALRPARKPVSR